MTGAAPISIRLDPPSATVTTGATATFNAIGRDVLGNEFPVSRDVDARGRARPAR